MIRLHTYHHISYLTYFLLLFNNWTRNAWHIVSPYLWIWYWTGVERTPFTLADRSHPLIFGHSSPHFHFPFPPFNHPPPPNSIICFALISWIPLDSWISAMLPRYIPRIVDCDDSSRAACFIHSWLLIPVSLLHLPPVTPVVTRSRSVNWFISHDLPNRYWVSASVIVRTVRMETKPQVLGITQEASREHRWSGTLQPADRVPTPSSQTHGLDASWSSAGLVQDLSNQPRFAKKGPKPNCIALGGGMSSCQH